MAFDLDSAAETAWAAVKFAQDVREVHRRRTRKGNAQRERDLATALKRLAAAMAPIRSELGRIQFQRPTAARDARKAKLSALSAAIQLERRKLWKMQARKKKK